MLNLTEKVFSLPSMKNDAEVQFALGVAISELPQRAKLAKNKENSRPSRLCQARRLAARVFELNSKSFSCKVQVTLGCDEFLHSAFAA